MTDPSFNRPPPGWRADFRAGYLALLPLWLGAAPFGVIYAVSALAAGLSPTQTLAMSLLVFAGAAQFTAVGMVAAGAGPFAITLTTLVLNARHLLLAASLAPYVRQASPWRRLLLALQLTDESYAMGMSGFLAGRGSVAFQFGCNLSMYTCWPLSTIVGIMLGQVIPNPAAYGLDLIFPLSFIGLLVPLLREQANRPAAALAALLTIGGALWLPGSWYVLLAGAGASGLVALVTQRKAPATLAADSTPGGTP